ncbi:MAG: long-chain-fatty-acid--CoA ligase [Alphaproteobacteria bacterium]|jgi:acyl-CoA synthetase (AMP-forming)/AMP-acid ligase II
MYLSQSLKRNAQTNKNGIATRFDGRQRTWSELRDRVARFAGGLRKLGVEQGDRVALLALNSDRYLEYYFGCYWCGAVVVPLNVRWSAGEHAYSLNDSGAATFIVDDKFLPMAPTILAEAGDVANLIYMGDGDTPDGWLNYEDVIASAGLLEDAGCGGEDLAGIFYTGGTTGFPKGVMLPHRGLWSSALGVAYGFNMTRDTVYLHAAPMFHLADGAFSMGAMVAGGSHAFIPAFDPAKTIEAIAEFGVTDVLMVPTMVKMVLDNPAFDSAKLATLKQVIYGASPMPEGVIRQGMDKLPNVGWCHAYGQTELSPLITFNPPEHHILEGELSGRLRSIGRAANCNEVKIVDEAGAEVPRHTIGEIIVRGPNAMLGYWNKPEETAAALKNGWVHTGDAAHMDDDGFIYIADRLKDMIISGGENIYSVEIESAISRHDAVAEVAVVGIPSDEWGEAVHAIVVPQADASVSEQEIIDHCRELIAGFKCPRSVEIRTETLPLSGAGKVLKRDLRAPFWEGRERQVN